LGFWWEERISLKGKIYISPTYINELVKGGKGNLKEIFLGFLKGTEEGLEKVKRRDKTPINIEVERGATKRGGKLLFG